MKLRNILVGVLVGTNICACSTMNQSLLTGTVTGAAIGAASGSGFSQENQSDVAGKGALIGAAVGLITSYFVHNGLEKRDADVRRETLLNLEKFGIEGLPAQPLVYPSFESMNKESKTQHPIRSR